MFRSRLQGLLLATLLGQPDREWTLEELARTCEEPYQTVSGEIRRLQSGGLVTTRTIGRSKLVRADQASPYFAPLAQLALMSFGPPLVVSEELAGLPGVEQSFIFGSWAARYNGEPGPPPHDVDVLLVGTPDRNAVDDAAQRARLRLGREVNVILRSRDRWEHDEDAFTVQLRTSPLLLVPVGVAAGSEEAVEVSPIWGRSPAVAGGSGRRARPVGRWQQGVAEIQRLIDARHLQQVAADAETRRRCLPQSNGTSRPPNWPQSTTSRVPTAWPATPLAKAATALLAHRGRLLTLDLLGIF